MDGTIQLPPNSTGPFVDTEQLTVSGKTVNRERDRIAGLGATEIADVRGNGLDAIATDYGLVVREAPANSQREVGFSTTLVRNTPQQVLATPAIGSGVTGYAMKAYLASTGMVLWTIAAGATILAVILTSGNTQEYAPPRGADACPTGQSFTVTAESIDPVIANVGGYVTFWWETH